MLSQAGCFIERQFNAAIIIWLDLVQKGDTIGENFIVTDRPGMNLTAGATLQNRKYVIQKLLRQSDLGVTYEAQHAYLEQTVALQTFNHALRQRRDFAELRQQFLSKVRSIVQQPAAYSVRVLDCFEEDGMPFVVLEIVPGQPLPLLTDWLPILAETIGAEIGAETIGPTQLTSERVPVKPDQEHQSKEHHVDSLLGHSAGSIRTNGLSGAASGRVGSVGGSDQETRPPVPGFDPSLLPLRTKTEHKTKQLPIASTTIATQIAAQRLPQSRPRSKAWMPLSLIFMSIMGSILGAGLGLSLRLAPTTQSDPAAETVPNPKPRLFGREQSFPSEADWPVSETPLFTSDPTPVEEPVYRISPTVESYTLPELPPLPDVPEYQDPVLPSPSPTAKTVTPPQFNDQAAPTLPIPTDAPAPITITPPDYAPDYTPIAPAAPSELNLLPAPIEPAPPAPEPAPPALPPTDPAVIQQ